MRARAMNRRNPRPARPSPKAAVRGASPEVRVREALPADEPAVSAMRLALLRDEARSQLFASPHPNAPARARRLTNRQLAADPGREITFIAVMGERPAGILRCVIVPAMALLRNSSHAMLTTAYVAPAARRKGVLAALLRAADEWCRARNVAEMRLHCNVENREGDAAWRALGFQPAQILHRRLVPKG